MKLSLLAILSWTAVFACISLAFIWIAPVAILALAFVPLAIVMVHLRFPSGPLRRIFYSTVFLFALVPAYISTIGPFNMWAIQYTYEYDKLKQIDQFGRILYSPLSPVFMRMPDSSALYIHENYVSKWMDYGREYIDYDGIERHMAPSIPSQGLF